MYVHPRTCMQRPQEATGPPPLSALFLETASLCFRSSPVQGGQLTSKLLWPTSRCPPALGLEAHVAMTDFLCA